MRRSSGMVLILVLIVLLIGGAFVYVAFDIANNSHTSSMNMVTEDRLYNAAQSGLEFGKARLWEYFKADDLNMDSMGTPVSLASLNAEDSSNTDLPTSDVPQPGGGITLEVIIVSCNYDAPASYIEGLPPVWDGGQGAGVGSSSLSGVGSSGFIDPNRNLQGNGAEGSSGFVIRSRATFAEDNRKAEIETMVVMKNE